jgi:hypothetical protein
VQRDIGIGTLLSEIDLARVKRLGINVNTDGTLLEFREIENLVDRFERIDIGRMGSVHFVDVGGDDATRTVGGVALLDAKILDLQPADGSHHPAVLVTMIVDAAELADFPADGHTFEDVIFEYKIAGVVAFGKEEVFVEGFRTDKMAKDIVLNIRECEFAIGDTGETLDPVRNGELLGGNLLVHDVPQIGFEKQGLTRDYSA